MELFQILVAKLVPLYVLVFLGWLAGRYRMSSRDALAPLLIYLITPLVLLKGAWDAQLTREQLSLPVIFFVLCCFMCLLAYKVAGLRFRSPAKNILAFAAGNANSGYFGLPAAVALLGAEAFPRAVLISFGFILFEVTLGFYITARGNFTARDSLRKVARLPSIYLFVLGLLLNVSGWHCPEPAQEFFLWIKGSYACLGMMLLGLALSALPRWEVDWSFTSFMLAFKFLLWPALVLGLLALDGGATPFFSPETRASMRVASILPLAANTVAVAAIHKCEPEKASVAVLISTLLGLILIPLWAAWAF